MEVPHGMHSRRRESRHTRVPYHARIGFTSHIEMSNVDDHFLKRDSCRFSLYVDIHSMEMKITRYHTHTWTPFRNHGRVDFHGPIVGTTLHVKLIPFHACTGGPTLDINHPGDIMIHGQVTSRPIYSLTTRESIQS